MCVEQNFSICVHRQLILIIELYSHYDVYDYLRQIALTLCSDKVSEVRWISYKLVGMPFCSCVIETVAVLNDHDQFLFFLLNNLK